MEDLEKEEEGEFTHLIEEHKYAVPEQNCFKVPLAPEPAAPIFDFDIPQLPPIMSESRGLIESLLLLGL